MRNDMRKKQEFTENFGSTLVGKWDKKFDKMEEIDNIHNQQLNITTDASFENWRQRDADAMLMMRMMR